MAEFMAPGDTNPEPRVNARHHYRPLLAAPYPVRIKWPNDRRTGAVVGEAHAVNELDTRSAEWAVETLDGFVDGVREARSMQVGFDPLLIETIEAGWQDDPRGCAG
jgi:hypothetical protein